MSPTKDWFVFQFRCDYEDAVLMCEVYIPDENRVYFHGKKLIHIVTLLQPMLRFIDVYSWSLVGTLDSYFNENMDN